MSGKENHYRWIRLLLDGMLVVAVIMVGIAQIHPGQASAGARSSPQAILAERPVNPARQAQASAMDDVSQTITSTVTLDDNTLAAMMAAENAAMTPPQYLIGLPIITR